MMDDALEADEYNKVVSRQNLVLATLVLEEFLKELSALAEEHFIFEGDRITM